MAGERGYLLTREDMQRIGRVLRWFETLSRETTNVTAGTGFHPIPQPNETVVWFAKVTGAIVTSPVEIENLHPGTLYVPDPTTDPPFRETECWIQPLTDQTLAEGDTSIARLVSWRAAEGVYDAMPVYTIAPGAAATDAGCGLLYDDEENEYTLDYATIAGPGISVETPTPPDCPFLYIAVGCGLSITDDVISLNLTSVVSEPLVWNNTTCDLSLAIGCHLTIDGDGALAVDTATLVGEASETSLVEVPVEAECTVIGVDLTNNTFSTEILDRVTFFGMEAGLLKLKVERNTYVNRFNLATLHIDREVGTPTEVVWEIDPCTFEDCCDVTELTITPAAVPNPQCEDELVAFNAGESGGLPPYTYFWDFDDGATSTASDPNHSFAEPGTYEVIVEVTDACGQFAEDTIIVEIATCPVGCAVPPEDDLDYEITSTCACASGQTGVIPFVSPGLWNQGGGGPCSGDGPFLVLSCEGDVWQLDVWSGACANLTLDSSTPNSLTFVTPDGCTFCDAPMTIVISW